MTRILIADDHDVVRSGVRAILEGQAGWEVVGEAENGKEAVDQALATRPDVVVLDYSLPLLNGIEATHQIRARVPGAEVLIFTMHDTATLVREVLEAGAKGFLLKSDARKFLIAAVGAWNREQRPPLAISCRHAIFHLYGWLGDGIWQITYGN